MIPHSFGDVAVDSFACIPPHWYTVSERWAVCVQSVSLTSLIEAEYVVLYEVPCSCLAPFHLAIYFSQSGSYLYVSRALY